MPSTSLFKEIEGPISPSPMSGRPRSLFFRALAFVLLSLFLPVCRGSGPPISTAMGGIALKPVPRDRNQGAIVFHEEGPCPWLARDTGFLGMTRAAGLLRARGFRVSASQLPLADLIPELSDRDILIIATKKHFSYSPADLRTFSRWIRSGGAALVMGEHEDAYASSSLGANHLLAEAGMAFTSDCLSLDGSAWFRTSDGPGGLSAEFYAVPEIVFSRVSGPDRPVPLFSIPDGSQEGAGKGIVLAAGARVGAGSLAAIADSEGFLNGGGRIGISAEGNPDLLLRLVSWLSKGGSIPSGPMGIPGRDKTGAVLNKTVDHSCGKAAVKVKMTLTRLWLLNGFGCLEPDEFIDGTGRFLEYLGRNGVAVTVSASPPAEGFDLTMVVSPTQGIPPAIADAISAKPSILVGDPWTRLDNFTDNGIFLTSLGMEDTEEYPLSPLAARYGAKVTHLALYDPSNQRHPTEVSAVFTQHAGATIPGTPVQLFRATAVEGGAGFSPLLQCPAGTLASAASLGMDERIPFSREMTLTHYDNSDVHPENVGATAYEAGLARDSRVSGGSSPPPPYSVVMASDRCLICGDAELFCGPAVRFKGHREFWKTVVTWIHELEVANR